MSAVFGWGKASTGALGIGGSEKDSITSPTQIKDLQGKEIVSISSGQGHSLVTLDDGKVFSCGANDFNQCGRDSRLSRLGLFCCIFLVY